MKSDRTQFFWILVDLGCADSSIGSWFLDFFGVDLGGGQRREVLASRRWRGSLLGRVVQFSDSSHKSMDNTPPLWIDTVCGRVAGPGQGGRGLHLLFFYWEGGSTTGTLLFYYSGGEALGRGPCFCGTAFRLLLKLVFHV